RHPDLGQGEREHQLLNGHLQLDGFESERERRAIARTNEYADCRRNRAYLNGERTTASLSRFGDRHGPVRSQKISLMNTVRNDAWKVAADTGFGLMIKTAEIA
ncbi:hypothetical protein, partial [Bradyrhizobium pachyrhizi]|uniref:hypothetical protein n=1 Tax=Bradyrhizobium pachyrhizi TaxID=280333 RepID=UPI001875F87A